MSGRRAAAGRPEAPWLGTAARRCCGAAWRCAHAPPGHLDDRHGRRFRYRAARGSWIRLPSAAISSLARSSRPSFKRNEASASLTATRRACASMSTAPAARAACKHCHLQGAPVDDVAEIRLADLRAIERQRDLRPAVRRSHPTRTCARKGTLAAAGSALPNAAHCSSRCEARLRANTRKSQSASRRRGTAWRSADPATIATRPGSASLRANSRLAMTVPMHAGPDDHDVEVAARGAHCSATPAREFRDRGRPPPVLKEDNAAFAGGSRSKAKSPKLRRRCTTLNGIGKHPHQRHR